MKVNLPLILIISLGLVIRIWALPSNPPGFFADEASIGVNAYSLLTNGKDEHGKPWPLFFQAFGEYKSPVQIYSTIPFVALFGLNEFVVRLPSAIYGTFTIIAIYFLTKIVVESFMAPKINKGVINHTTTVKVQQAGLLQTLPLLTAFFLAISPWHVHFSRSSLEGLVAFVFFTTLATYFFLKSLHSQASSFQFLTSIFAFTLALYSYFPARLFIPLFVSDLLFIFRKKFSCRTILKGGVLFFFLAAPLFLHVLSGQGLARFQQVSLFAQTHLTLRQKLVHITTNYLNHFSPTFLFTKGDIDFPGQFITRHSVRGMGQLYLWQAPLLILGIFFLLKTGENFIRSDKSLTTLKVLGLWLALYPLGSALTADKSPFATRSIIGVVPFQILSALGLIYLLSLIKIFLTKFATLACQSLDEDGWCFLSKSTLYLLSSIFALIITTNFTYYLRLYFLEYPTYAADFWGWQYGPREIIAYFRDHQEEYDEFYLQPEFNAPEIFLKFYAPNGECQKCFIGSIGEKFSPHKRQLFAITPVSLNQADLREIVPAHSKIVHRVSYPNGQAAFFLITSTEN